MELEPYHDLFVASAGAAAALIGLLFVAISFSPERIIGEESTAESYGNAQRAFYALLNVFFVSLIALIPKMPAMGFAIVAGLTLYLLIFAAVRQYRMFPEARELSKLGGIAFLIYALEAYLALRPDAKVEGIVFVVLGLYMYALTTSWNLVDAKQQKVKSTLRKAHGPGAEPHGKSDTPAKEHA